MKSSKIFPFKGERKKGGDGVELNREIANVEAPIAQITSTHAGSMLGHRTEQKYPPLESIISNQSSAPYTLSNLQEYLRTIHCQEPLDLILMGYQFSTLFTSDETSISIAEKADKINEVRQLWNKIVSTFLLDSSPQEVNLPGELREHFYLIPVSQSVTTENYKHLQQAIEYAKDIIKENNFMLFIRNTQTMGALKANTRAKIQLNTSFMDQDHSIGHGRGYSIGSSPTLNNPPHPLGCPQSNERSLRAASLAVPSKRNHRCISPTFPQIVDDGNLITTTTTSTFPSTLNANVEEDISRWTLQEPVRMFNRSPSPGTGKSPGASPGRTISPSPTPSPRLSPVPASKSKKDLKNGPGVDSVTAVNASTFPHLLKRMSGKLKIRQQSSAHTPP
ncbi:hypothetical protein AWJ20_3946 [Sugiyamaella lignohabitans]|uniref:RGS domain-containing protein n=1 Tax=Sugiyamaella lignohabitans TaxID=796027 RepID=A0A167C2R2_9ASCO|nr:uncharacterized protein AWJ20_3946 [Sugiyamaella lignohabitans]ANB11146.1 hypothetical protein AWJ20_3946 [Sugiyamaella lignohabitans]